MSAQREMELLAAEIVTHYSVDYHQRNHYDASSYSATVADCSASTCRKATQVITAFSGKKR